MITDRLGMTGSPAEVRALNARWREVAAELCRALPTAALLEVRCVLRGGRVSQGVTVYDAAFGTLEVPVEALDLDVWLGTCLEVLGPGWYWLRQVDAFRQVVPR